MTSNIKCRKCGGQHFTIKCNNNKEINKNINKDINKEINKDINKDINNNKYQHCNKLITYRVKISELPNDITENEIMEQLYEWGDIIKLKLLNYNDNSILYIDFKQEDQAEYFIRALNKTYFEHNIILVSRI